MKLYDIMLLNDVENVAFNSLLLVFFVKKKESNQCFCFFLWNQNISNARIKGKIKKGTELLNILHLPYFIHTIWVSRQNPRKTKRKGKKLI